MWAAPGHPAYQPLWRGRQRTEPPPSLVSWPCPQPHPRIWCVQYLRTFLCACDREKEAGTPGNGAQVGRLGAKMEVSESLHWAPQRAGGSTRVVPRCHGLKGPLGGPRQGALVRKPGSLMPIPQGAPGGSSRHSPRLLMAPGWAVP